jgi:hypothetical protein
VDAHIFRGTRTHSGTHDTHTSQWQISPKQFGLKDNKGSWVKALNVVNQHNRVYRFRRGESEYRTMGNEKKTKKQREKIEIKGKRRKLNSRGTFPSRSCCNVLLSYSGNLTIT